MADPALVPSIARSLAGLEGRLAVLERRGGSPGTASGQVDVTAAEATTSTTYTDLNTPGPAVTVTVAPGQLVLVIVSATMSGATALASYDITGDATAAAIDSNAAVVDLTSPQRVRSSRISVAGNTGGEPLTVTFTMRYRVTAGTGTFGFRRILVVPL